MESYPVGSFICDKFTVSSQRGTLDLSTSFVSASIYESIFTPGTVCDIVVLDTNDQLGQLRFTGGEPVVFSITVPGSINATFDLHLDELTDLQTVGAQKAKQYTFKCVSKEIFCAQTNQVQKAYTNMLCSEIIQDIIENNLLSDKQTDIEDTKGPQNININHERPYKAINMVKSRAVSQENSSSVFVFFENRADEQSVMNFTTIERLFQREPVKSFKQSDALNISIYNRQDDNILAYKIPNQFTGTEKVETGGRTEVKTFNFTTHQYEAKIIDTSDTAYKDGGGNQSDINDYIRQFSNSTKPPQVLIPVDISQRPETNIAESVADKQSYLAMLVQNSMKIRVSGDTQLTAGVTINCDIPNKSSTVNPGELDPLMTGKFLITRIHHKIGLFQEQPRYTCIIECCKGKFEEGV